MALGNTEAILKQSKVAREGGSVAGNARKDIEKRTGRQVIIAENAKQLNSTVTGMIEGVSKEVRPEGRE